MHTEHTVVLRGEHQELELEKAVERCETTLASLDVGERVEFVADDAKIRNASFSVLRTGDDEYSAEDDKVQVDPATEEQARDVMRGVLEGLLEHSPEASHARVYRMEDRS